MCASIWVLSREGIFLVEAISSKRWEVDSLSFRLVDGNG